MVCGIPTKSKNYALGLKCISNIRISVANLNFLTSLGLHAIHCTSTTTYIDMDRNAHRKNAATFQSAVMV